MASSVILKDGKFMVGSQELEPGMIILRKDRVSNEWFQGETCNVSSFDFQKRERLNHLSLSVPGYVPSPIIEGDEIEIIDIGIYK